MSALRPLGEMLGEVTSGAVDALSEAPKLRVSRIAVTLPVELKLNWIGNQVQILGDLPRMITRTAFDVEPARIEVIWEARELS